MSNANQNIADHVVESHFVAHSANLEEEYMISRKSQNKYYYYSPATAVATVFFPSLGSTKVHIYHFIVIQISPPSSGCLTKSEKKRQTNTRNHKSRTVQWRFIERRYIDIFITGNATPRMTNDWFVFIQLCNAHGIIPILVAFIVIVVSGGGDGKNSNQDEPDWLFVW